MKRKLTKILASLLCVVMIITVAPVSGFVGIEIPWLSDLFKIEASASSYSGTCGDNLTWTLDTETGMLDITGTGDMTNWQYSPSSPWYSYRSYIKFVNIGNSVTSIGNHAFGSCRNLISVTIPNSVTSIGNYAFNWCDSLISATIGNSVTSIGTKAFYNCDSLTSITIPDSVTSIGNYAFEDCERLASVTIPDSVTSIGDWAFVFCDSLTSVTIGNSVTSIGTKAFYNCDNLEKITVDINNKYYSNDEYGVLFNKDKTTLIQYPMGNTRTAYTIPDFVTSIGAYAFYDCDRLTSVTIPDSVTSIGNDAFGYCKSLTSITIPDSVTSIGYGAFYCCISLTSVTIGNSVTSIGGHAFYYCISLTSVTIGNSVTSIGDGAFYDCDSLTSVTIPDSVTNIGICAFYWCGSLTSITIPDSVTIIGMDAFNDCDNLEKITVDINNKYYSNDEYGVLFNKAKTTLIQYPNGNTRTTYTIPDSVTSIGMGAFYDCDSLTSVTIPDSVTSIGEFAFGDCDSLTDVYYFSTEDQWNKIKIGYSNELLTNATIHFNSPGKDFHPHSYTSTVTKEATCSVTGVKTYTCTCGDTYSKEIPVADHSLTHKTVASTCKAQGYEYDYCSSCNGLFNKIYISTAEHSWGEWKVIEEPTSEDKGVKTRECFVCHDIETDTIPELKKVIKVTIDDFVVKYKEPYKLIPKVEMKGDVDYTVTYTSLDNDVVTIDQNGNITTKDKGTATITVTVTDEFGNEVKDTCQVEVKLKWWQWIIWILLWGWLWY